jgi:hypothetical protein
MFGSIRGFATLGGGGTKILTAEHLLLVHREVLVSKTLADKPKTFFG